MKKVAFITEIAFLATVISACGGDSASNPETLTALSDESKPVEMSSSVREELSDDLSSSGRTQSSASIGSSSSSAVAIGIDPSTVVAGILTDSRDGQTYRTVKIGEQVWMAENMNYKVEDSYCYNDEDSNCDKYGRLYTWSAAITACPNGWHLPSKDEYGTLFLIVGGERIAGKMLKSTSGWSGDGNCTDVYSFAMLPAGFRYDNYDGEGNAAVFWSFYYDVFSDEEKVFWGPYDFLFFDDDGYMSEMFSGLGMDELIGASVRCVEGEPSVTFIESSSSSIEESSSSFESSSSENETILIDSRDGQTYRTVKIGDQVWMAENLNYETEKSYCYDDDESNCIKYGRLYRWEVAVGKVECGTGTFCDLEGNVRGVCPNGWHIPSLDDWNTLLSFTKVGSVYSAEKLKSSSGWDSPSENCRNCSGDGSDDLRFTAVPAGMREPEYYCGTNCYKEACYTEMGYRTCFWGSSSGHPDAAHVVCLSYSYEVSDFDDNKFYGYSVRCVKD